MNILCPICNKKLKRIVWKIIGADFNSGSLPGKRSFKLNIRSCPGDSNKDHNHCYYCNDYMIITIYPYHFKLDFLNKKTILSKYNEIGELLYIMTLNSILDLPWKHKAQCFKKIKLYSLFS